MVGSCAPFFRTERCVASSSFGPRVCVSEGGHQGGVRQGTVDDPMMFVVFGRFVSLAKNVVPYVRSI